MVQFKVTVSTFPYEEPQIVQKFILPMKKEVLLEKVKVFGEKEYFLSDIENPYGFQFHEYTNLFLLNEFATLIEEYELEDETLIALAFLEDSNISALQEMIKEEGYSIISSEDVYTDQEQDLGYTLYVNGMITEELPENLVDLGYIDFASIGRDYSINQGWEYCRKISSYVRKS